eukprot:m.800468 g.800468  ORF g.800468 m.800468 type:complete len:159 (+) comp59267_c1_seq7:230-706(+)
MMCVSDWQLEEWIFPSTLQFAFSLRIYQLPRHQTVCDCLVAALAGTQPSCRRRGIWTKPASRQVVEDEIPVEATSGTETGAPNLLELLPECVETTSDFACATEDSQVGMDTAQPALEVPFEALEASSLPDNPVPAAVVNAHTPPPGSFALELDPSELN